MTLHVLRDGGDDLAVVLLHGFPLDHRMWTAVAGRLTAPHRVLAADLPGAAGADADLPEPSVEAAADRVAAELAEAGVTRAVVVGLSMGGYVALALAERHAPLVAALGLVDTKSTADTADARAHRLRIADEAESTGTVDPVRGMATTLVGESTRAAQPDVTAQLAAWIDEQSPGGVAWAQRAMASRPDRTDVLAAFDGPVVVVVGDEDAVTPVAAAEHLASSARDAQLVVVPRSGHMSAVEQPGAVAAALDDLVQRAVSS
ncbi:alpha/beta fold hydrolase [Cellulomonas uda]|uniref:Hydrolase n=1 Tax=Cellulomonas uda TaxID=1714 RepID=A0A4Y3KB18_CELUD|nr:alpha/beta fold hydrolase [Cellulomonas uda]NII67266.1 pimeloyl-ACP methyl ester carboxylesterase [Cellulomonas uda]GEA81649.1 hydrolase [Cellulomonas uda]